MPQSVIEQTLFNSASGLLMEQFSVYDISGKLLKQREINQQKEIEINLESFRSGVYLIKMQSDDNVFVKRFIKR